jgi:hypothetical protein
VRSLAPSKHIAADCMHICRITSALTDAATATSLKKDWFKPRVRVGDILKVREGFLLQLFSVIMS